MSLTLFSLSGAPSVQSSARPAERDNGPQTPAAGSFGEALSRASQSADEPAPKPSGKASNAAAATATRRSGKSEDEPDKPEQPDLVENLALMMLNSRNSPPIPRSAGTDGEPMKESAITPQDEAVATARTTVQRSAVLAKDLNKSVETDLHASLELTASGSLVATASPNSQAPQPAGTDPLALNLENVSSPVPAAAVLSSTVTGLVASADTGSKPTLDPALLAVLASQVNREQGRPAISARQEVSTQATTSDVVASPNSRAPQPVGTDPLALNLENVSSPVPAAAVLGSTTTGLVASTDTGSKPTLDTALLAVLASQVNRERGRPATSAGQEVNTQATTANKVQIADPRATTDPATFIPPAQNNSGLPAAGIGGENAEPGKIAVTQTMTSGLSAQAGAQAQFEVLTSSQSTSRFSGPDGNAAADSTAATSMLGSPLPARFDVATGTMTSSIAGTTNGIAPVLPQKAGSTDWGTALGQHVLHMSRTGQETAELQLNPPGLGPLKVSLSMNEHQIQAAFVSTHASVRAAVEAALPQLRAAMADGGISLGETSVGSQSQQAADTRQGREDRPSSRGQLDSPNRELAGATQRAATEPRRRVDGASVDIYA